MDLMLCQVKAAIESASRPMDMLLQKKYQSEEQTEKKCIVTPEIEVSILHNANLDLEILLKQKKEEAKQLEDTIEELKSSFQKVNEEKIELLKKHEDELRQISITLNGNNSEQSDSISEGQMKKELSICQEEVERMKVEMKQNQESNKIAMDSLLKEKEALLANIKQLEIEIKSSTEQNASLTSNLESARKETEELKQQVELAKATPNENELSELSVVKTQLAELTEQSIKNQTKIDSLQNEVSKQEALKEEALKELQVLQQKVDASSKELTQPISNEDTSVKKQLEEENCDLHEKVEELTKSVAMANAEKQKAEALERSLKEQVRLLEQREIPSTSTPKKSEETASETVQSDEKKLDTVVNEYEKKLMEKEEEIVELRKELTRLKEKELNCSRYEEQSKRMTKEIDNLHTQIQKQTSKSNEEMLTLQNRAQFAEQSLEAYKREIEESLKEKMQAENEVKELRNKMEILQKVHDNNVSELNETRKAIKTYEESITRLQTLEATKDETLLLNVKEIAELKAEIVKEKAAKITIEQTLAEESVRMQSQLESFSEENSRLRQALEKKRVEDDQVVTLLRESEAKIDHWREGLENSYQQKRVLKEAVKKVLENDSVLNERIQRERSARRALERSIMIREDLESAMRSEKQEEGFDKEFSSFEWGRRLSRFIARNPLLWKEYSENVPAMPEEAAVPVIQNTIDTLEWNESEKRYLLNWLDFYSHGGMLENENGFTRSLQIQGITYDILDGFVTLMIPYLKAGIRSDYAVNTFIKQKPSVICDLEVAITPVNQRVTGESVDMDSGKVVIHKVSGVCYNHHLFVLMALSSEEIRSLESRLDSHNRLMTLALDFDSDDEETITEALTVLHSILEKKDVSVKDIIDNNLSTSLVSFLEYRNGDLLCELFGVISLIYQQATEEQRSHFFDLGIHSQLISLLDEMDGDTISQALYCLSIMCSTDHSEQENLSNNEIWPILESIMSKYQDDIQIMKNAAVLLSTLVKPINGNHAEMNGVSLIMDHIFQIIDMYNPFIFEDSVGEENQKHDSEIIIYNLFIVLFCLTEVNTSIEDYFDTFVAPFVSDIIPIVVSNIQSQFSVICLKIISNLIITTNEICQQIVDEGIIDSLAVYMRDRVAEEKKVPSYYARWLVLFIISNIAADSEDMVDLLINSELFSCINEEIKDPLVNKGLFTEYVYLISNLIFSASEEQRNQIVESLPMNVIMGIIKECRDEVCNLAATTVQLLVDNGYNVDLQDSIVFDQMDFVASSYSYDPYDN